MFTKRFWVETAERAIKTMAQTLIPLVTATMARWPDQLNWEHVLVITASTTLLSVLSSLASVGKGRDPQSPSVV